MRNESELLQKQLQLLKLLQSLDGGSLADVAAS